MSTNNLAGFLEHGVVFLRSNDAQASGTCPLCRKDKFYANPVTRLWDCKVCGAAGNFPQFLEWRMQWYVKQLIGTALAALSKDRKLRPQTFRAFGVGYDPSSQQYMIPMRGNPTTGTIGDIHRFKIGKRAYSTATAKLQLIVPLQQDATSRRWVCEGEWDGMAWYECLRRQGCSDYVCASPGAGTFPRHAVDCLRGADTCLLFDNDIPGRRGSIRTGNLLSGVSGSVKHLHWPLEQNFSDGFDIRDLYTAGAGSPAQVLEFVTANLRNEAPTEAGTAAKVAPVGASSSADGQKPPSSVSVATKPRGTGAGIHHSEVLQQYRKWLHLRNPQALEVLYGTCFANRLPADPLWMFVIAPPGGSKTELLISLSDADDILTTTSLTPQALMSGANTASGDPSLIPLLNRKLLVIKDFTTILNLQQAVRDEIFGILRDAYDGKTEKRFGNGTHRCYSSKFGILAGVTPAIDEYSGRSSVLGERFIKYRIPNFGRIQTGQDVIKRAILNLNRETRMREELRGIAVEVLSRPLPDTLPVITESIAERITFLAQWVAAMRGQVSRDRYTSMLNFKPVSEIGTRLAKQFCCLAQGIAIYRQEDYITEDVLRTVYKVCKDTAPDRNEEVIKQMYLHGDSADHSLSQLCKWTRFPSATISQMIEDLELLHIVKRTGDVRNRTFRLNPSMAHLMRKTGMYSTEFEQSKQLREVRERQVNNAL